MIIEMHIAMFLNDLEKDNFLFIGTLSVSLLQLLLTPNYLFLLKLMVKNSKLYTNILMNKLETILVGFEIMNRYNIHVTRTTKLEFRVQDK